ncbi:MAG TPA: SprT family zinc-dependent metalloprotease [Sphingorhabdus sp.]|jgi:predicted metal-dependent hydrolase|uniref:M48 family metallopeptidase n=1 Tax=Sphingorhabdus sp. TaxID=1902408 RepID=UPI002CAD60C9|nr:SprT family zinc-dependent metalloprotease [Sphingorhabdus sp.]HMT41883.1 SprT family zinc-dependent metalloprotease [Sphingorhabdus sp.]HMU23165.1 SprT family zinc-dependent metalloprotease [Sphingorhabdus sp.]
MLDRLKTILSNSLSDPKAGDPVVDIEGQQIPVRIKRTRQARRISMRADAIRREIRITMPVYAPTTAALDFVAQKRQWIATRFETAPVVAQLVHGSHIAFIGERHRIVWNNSHSRRVRRLTGDQGFELHLGGPEEMVGQRILRWMREEARPIFAGDISEYCCKAGETPPQLAIGDPRSRWGSCSSRGTISLSWRLIMAPAFVRRSVIAHEVAHMRHMDHSPAFYAWFDELFEGDRRAADHWLKAHGTSLQLVGR